MIVGEKSEYNVLNILQHECINLDADTTASNLWPRMSVLENVEHPHIVVLISYSIRVSSLYLGHSEDLLDLVIAN